MICVSAITIHEYFIFAFNKIDLWTPALSIITCVTVAFSTDCSCAFNLQVLQKDETTTCMWVNLCIVIHIMHWLNNLIKIIKKLQEYTVKNSFNYQYVYVIVSLSVSNTFLTIVAIKTNEYREKNITLKCEHAYRCSNFVTNCYGESWDSFCEES